MPPKWMNLRRLSGHTLFVVLFSTAIIGSLIGIKIGSQEKVTTNALPEPSVASLPNSNSLETHPQTATNRRKFSSSFVDNNSLKTSTGTTPPVCADQRLDVVNIVVEVYNVNYAASQLQVSNSFLPCGSFVSRFDSFGSFTSTNMGISIDSTAIQFASGQAMTNKTTNVYIEGDANNYPLDTFSVSFNVRGTFGDANPLPIIVYAFGQPLGYTLQLQVIGNSDNTAASVIVTASRNPTTIAFALAIMLLMWIMSLLAIALAYAVWTVPGKKVELPFIIFTVALLFAMPTVRTAMPNAPPIGVLADQMVTGWAMMLLSLAVISHFVNLLYHIYKDAKAAEREASQAGHSSSYMTGKVEDEAAAIARSEYMHYSTRGEEPQLRL
ncbi:hypothetical protein BJ741DRAFT_128461 [Chytriomyces cf. hyalinus JEL632]|nr:hypothetical protein BJ741DRAFT_128461 [Chytriomyces cf. hyalinus JEL632]